MSPALLLLYVFIGPVVIGFARGVFNAVVTRKDWLHPGRPATDPTLVVDPNMVGQPQWYRRGLARQYRDGLTTQQNNVRVRARFDAIREARYQGYGRADRRVVVDLRPRGDGDWRRTGSDA